MGNLHTIQSDPSQLPPSKREKNIFKLIQFAKDPRGTLERCRDHHGDLFLLESAVVHEKIVGFCGPEMLKQYDEKVAQGIIVREGAFPPGIIELLGNILPTLDGEIHDERKVAVMEAFSPDQLQLYKPIIYDIIEKDYQLWANQNGQISIALNVKKMVFKVFLAILYGVTPADYDNTHDRFRAFVDGYIHAIPKSAKKAHPDGISSKKTILDELIAPAIKESQQRVANSTAIPCVLDVLIAKNQLPLDVIHEEAFHFLFAGLGGVQCLVVNTFTAEIVHSQVAAKLHQSLEAFTATYPNPLEHLNELGYANHFLTEVTRIYRAGPTQLFTRTTEDIEFTTADGVFKIPKGALAVAGLEATSTHPNIWSEPMIFNPDRYAQERDESYMRCPFSIGKQVGGRKCAGYSLAMLILQCALVARFDYTWEMTPNQDYTLEIGSSTPMPVGHLVAVDFKRKSFTTCK
ncbi:hypothetical protein THRCLA_00897 [Thraustotheca clavata]|uniref:Cytochrome P450 n=1 Tax=Thraustotheca clavata TaxID=74557 RepID=A0A1W0A9Y9_9STRA|nr:hypothetical protein THRCLA_00897 [Thraustotheca clavata]